jgi:hydroxyethylthiazole kinase-like uncharacterized protein yjeF
MEIADRANGAAAVLIGPGMTGGASVSRLLRATLPTLRDSGVVILDAHALDGAPGAVEAVRGCAPRALLTPHAGEMARLLDVERHDVETHPVELGHKAAEIFQAVVVLKGARTTVSTPEGACYQYDEGDIGLATSGSGDTLSGIIAGLAARGADASQAAVWGVFLHGSAGNHLRQRIGRLGFLARELLDEVPQIIAELDHKPLAESRRRRNLPGR